jgi:hypothetical protein
MKFNKKDVIVVTNDSDLNGRTGVIRHSSVNGSYVVDIDIYPSHYQLEQHLIPPTIQESDMIFEDPLKERKYKLDKLLG